MKNSWRGLFRRLAAACVVSSATAWWSAMCYAQIVATDVATDPVYADGWQAGDNGGIGFTPWNFDSDPGSVGTQTIDTTSTFDSLKPAWRIANNPDITRAGRGFAPLQVGQTVRLIVDNPTEHHFFKGYIIRFNTGGGNICYAGSACTAGTTPKERLGVYTFEYFTYGNWLVSDHASGNHGTTLFDEDTAQAGVQIDLTLTGPESYSLVMDPLGTAATYTQSGSLGNTGTGSIDWLEFVFFNGQTDTNFDTDFYIKSIQILGSAPPGVPGDYNNNGVVDAADYVLWRKGGPLQNEVDTPGTVNAADYTAWRARFGNPSGAGSGALSSAVPEPGMLVTLFAAVGSLCTGGLRSLLRFGRSGRESR